MTNFLKEYKWWLVFGTLALLGDIRDGDLFYILVLSYIWCIKLLLSDYLKPKVKKVISISIWVAFISCGLQTFYANHYFPHGPMYDTGDVVCSNDDRGPCAEEYIEDIRNLKVPDWVKFSRTYGIVFFTLLLLAGIASENKELES